MRTHTQIIRDAGGPSALARAIDVDPNTAKAWTRSDSIPGRYWALIAEAKMASLEELAEADKARPAA
jgi:hypothetical protein